VCLYSFSRNVRCNQKARSMREQKTERMAINTIIVDDEKPAREELSFLLKGFRRSTSSGKEKTGWKPSP
jgi:hypothetical protein